MQDYTEGQIMPELKTEEQKWMGKCRNGHVAGVRRVDKNKWIIDCYSEDCAVRRVYGKTMQEAIDKWNARRFL
jgi:hypothetical protein